MTITEFLLARVTEDETAAHEAMSRSDAHWENEPRLGQVWTVAHDEDRVIHMPAMRSPLGEHIARHDPARVLAECEAKRRIVVTHQFETWAPGASGSPHCTTCADWENADYDGPPEVAWPCLTMRALALPYADHPDFNPGWRP